MTRNYSNDDEYIISEHEQNEIIDYVLNNHKKFKITSASKHSQRLDYSYPKIFLDIRNRIIEREHLQGCPTEPIAGDFISYITDSGKIYIHKDANQGELINIRFNVYVQLPENGGLPVYSRIVCALQERTYVCCRSGLDCHETQTVIGPKGRITISYGFLMKEEDIGEVKYNYDPFPMFSI